MSPCNHCLSLKPASAASAPAALPPTDATKTIEALQNLIECGRWTSVCTHWHNVDMLQMLAQSTAETPITPIHHIMQSLLRTMWLKCWMHADQLMHCHAQPSDWRGRVDKPVLQPSTCRCTDIGNVLVWQSRVVNKHIIKHELCRYACT